MTTPLRSQILSTISIYDRLKRPDLVRIVAFHDITASHELIEFAIDLLVEEGQIGQQFGISPWEDEFFHIEGPRVMTFWDDLRLCRAAFIYRRRMAWSALKRFLHHPFRTIHQVFRKTKNEGGRQ